MPMKSSPTAKEERNIVHSAFGALKAKINDNKDNSKQNPDNKE